MTKRTWILLAALLAASPAAAAEAVDVELVLAADGSGSIDDDELQLQRQGYADAIRSVEVMRTIVTGIHGRIAIAYVEWGGPASQHTIVDWTIIEDSASAERFAEALVAAPRAAYGYNSISAAIDYSVHKIETNDIESLRRVIDVSGDGPNIGGRPVTAARDDAVARGIVINALLISRPGGLSMAMPAPQLRLHYERDVTGGPGAFVMVADATTTFADAVRRKMILEIAALEDPGRAGRPASLP
ncbi:DUF1194 domain-containing protein [Amorphus sp. MBR-141]